MVSVTHLILKFAIVQNKLEQTNKNKINHINDNHIKSEVSLHFGGIWPIVRQSTGQCDGNSTIIQIFQPIRILF